jgi:hypothetical protein|tara:strand:+ start:548 stop:943 length:396 start_codon:yes stop_codon:yes gene_type:complete
MKYPRLSDKQDLRRKLMDADIASLKVAYAVRPTEISERQWRIKMALSLGVSPSTIAYHTNPDYRAKMLVKNRKAHSKAVDPEDYARHRAEEIKHRQNRLERNPDLREWHYQVSAKNEKRTQRTTVLGKPLQ